MGTSWEHLSGFKELVRRAKAQGDMRADRWAEDIFLFLACRLGSWSDPALPPQSGTPAELDNGSQNIVPFKKVIPYDRIAGTSSGTVVRGEDSRVQWTTSRM
jgi:hypothetical protein